MLITRNRDAIRSVLGRKQRNCDSRSINSGRKASSLACGQLAPWVTTGEAHYNEQIRAGEMGEKEKQTGARVVERGRTEEMKVLRTSVGDLFATQGHDDLQAQSAANDHV